MRKLQMTCPTTQACGWWDQDKTLPYHNPLIQYRFCLEVENIGNWYEFLDAVSYLHYSAPQASCEPSNHKAEWVWDFSWLQRYGFCANPIQFPIPSGCPTVNWLLRPYLWSHCQCHRLRYQDSPDFRCQPFNQRLNSEKPIFLSSE